MRAALCTDIELFVRQLETRRVLSVAPLALPAVAVVVHSEAESASYESLSAGTTSEQQQDSPEALAPLAQNAAAVDSPSAVADGARAERLAALLGQAILLSPGSSGLGEVIRLHAADVAPGLVSEPGEEPGEFGLGTSLLGFVDRETGLGLDSDLLPLVDSSAPGIPAGVLPAAPPAELYQQTAPGENVASDAIADPHEIQVDSEAEANVPSEETATEPATQAVASADGHLFEVEAGTSNPEVLGESESIVAALAAGDLAALRRSLEALLLELSRFDPNGADATTKLVLLLGLSAAAAATAAGCAIARRQLKRETGEDAGERHPAARSQQLEYEPLLA